MMFLPRSTIAMSVMAMVWPVNVAGHFPVSAHHIFSCISAPPDSTTTPDGKKRHLYTSPTWPFRFSCKYSFRLFNVNIIKQKAMDITTVIKDNTWLKIFVHFSHFGKLYGTCFLVYILTHSYNYIYFWITLYWMWIYILCILFIDFRLDIS